MPIVRLHEREDRICSALCQECRTSGELVLRIALEQRTTTNTNELPADPTMPLPSFLPTRRFEDDDDATKRVYSTSRAAVCPDLHQELITSLERACVPI